MMKISKKEVIDALWHRGIVAAHYLRPHQRELYNLICKTSRDIVVPNISRRFGKTTTCVAYAIEQCMQKKQVVRYATAFLTDLKEFLLPICNDVLSSCPAELLPQYKSSEKAFYFKNGSILKLIGIDKNPNGLRGNAVDLLIVDEAAFIDNLEYLWLSIILPATLHRDFKIMFPSTPPKDTEHYWLTLMARAKKSNTYIEKTLDDNTHLPQHEKDRILSEYPSATDSSYLREYYCKVTKDEKTVITPEYNEEKHVMCIERPLYTNLQTVIDVGGTMDKTGIALFYYNFHMGTMDIIASALVDRNSGTETIVAKVLELEEKHFPDGRIDRIMDCPGVTRIDFSKAGLPTRPPRKEKGSAEANVTQLRLALQNSKIRIHNEFNDDLKTTLDLGQWNKSGTDYKRTTLLGHWDLGVAVAYGYRELNRGNPFPKDYGLDPTTARIKDANRSKNNANWLLD